MDAGAQAGGQATPQRPVSAGRSEAVLDELAAFEHAVRLVCVDPATNRYRAYALTWQRWLWGEVALVRTWGRLDRPGRSRATVYADRQGARADIRRLLQRRLRHGYQIVACR